MRIGSLNVNGLKRRLCYPEFCEYINEHDILCILETNLDQYDTINYDGYQFVHKHRNTLSNKKSGGIGVFIKNNFANFIEIIDSDCDYILWFKFSQKALFDDEIIIGAVYLPPSGSRYLDADLLVAFENEISNKSAEYKHCLLIGDMNARTSRLSDFIENDNLLSSLFGFDDDTLDYFNKHLHVESLGIPLERASHDDRTNTHGLYLIDICRSTNLFIVNGRMGSDKGQGTYTFKDKSVIDYAISSTDLLPLINDFKVINTDPLFSDGHSALSLSLLCKVSNNNILNDNIAKPMRSTWNSSRKDEFVENIDISSFSNMISLTDDKEAIELITSELSTVFNNARDKTFVNKYSGKSREGDKPWFGNDCQKARTHYHKAKRRHNRTKTNDTKNDLVRASKHYKATMNKNINSYKSQNEHKLRALNDKSPKKYWKLINSLKSAKKEEMPSINQFYDFFKMQNSDTENEEFSIPQQTSDNSTNDILNCAITEDEINKHVHNLQNGKACGPSDLILNEYIKNTIDLFMPIYVNLFNRVLDSGIIPECWLQGFIIPIYKKGDPLSPSNYRPITILSCLGKLFTSILNTRVSNYLEDTGLLHENQAGFRKGYSTSDHIFVLHGLLNILKRKKQKLFCAFIDFAAAFDSVWRIGVWQKLLSNSISGKIFKVIYNMYTNIKSCVFNNGNKSLFFPCQRGLRQGENLSPIIFSIFLNDLQSHLLASGSAGIDIEVNDAQGWLKLLVLLYADDTLILSDNATDFQNSLNNFSQFCSDWKLNVNHSKSNIIIFGARKITHFHFTLNGQKLEITDKYKYLGIYFTANGSFLTARKHLVGQARKAMHLLYSRIQNLELPIDLQLKLFDHTIVPILTYGSEVWGFESLDLIENIHNSFLRRITKARKSTPIYMLHGELGRYPISIIIKSRMIGYWNRILTGKPSKLAYQLYCAMLHTSYDSFKWTKHIHSIFIEIGRPDIWIDQLNYTNVKRFNCLARSILIDQYRQNWHSCMQLSNKGRLYNSFKNDLALEKYWKLLSSSMALNMFRLRTENNKFPIETGRWNGTPHNDRTCNLCNSQLVGNGPHYILNCAFFNTQRTQYLPMRYHRSTPQTYQLLLCTENQHDLSNLSKLAGITMRHFYN